MHDPMVVAFDIHRPWPSHPLRKPTRPVPRWKLSFPFMYVAGREWYFPSLITIWHVEPGGRDSGEVCKHHTSTQDPETGKWTHHYSTRWKWHVWHWKIQVSPLQSLRAFLFDRCETCGRKGRPNHGYMSGTRSLGWWKFKSRGGLYHSECMDLNHTRQTIAKDEALIRHLFAAYRLSLDLSEADALARLTDPRARGLEFAESYRLTGLLGFKRTEGYQLVKVAASPGDPQ
jgi:hypothetical protein